MTSTHRTRLFALLPLLLSAAVPAFAGDDPPEWRRRGSRAPGAAWDALEGEPAPSLAVLSGWQHVPPLDWADLEGNVVMLVHFEAWQPNLDKELKRLLELHVAHHADGLVVLPVHSPQNRRALELYLKTHFVQLPLAIDGEGSLAAATAVKRHPTYHLVGRDGRMRIAGLSLKRDEAGARYLDQAVAAVLAEPWEGERRVLELDLPLDRVLAAAREEVRMAGGTDKVEEKAPLVLGEDGWPRVVEKHLHARLDLRGKRAPTLEAQAWFGDAPDVQGKCWLAFLFSTTDGAGPSFFPKLQRMHVKYGDDLVVAAISPQAPAVRSVNGRPWADTLKDFFDANPEYEFYRAYDGESRVQTAVDAYGLPYAILVDSGGTVRWQGYPYDPKDPLTKKLVGAVIERDAKRRADEAREKAEEEGPGGGDGDGGDGEGEGGDGGL